MNLRKRLKRVEERAEHYLETVDDRNCDENEVTRMLRAMGGKGLAKILKEIDGKTRGLASERG